MEDFAILTEEVFDDVHRKLLSAIQDKYKTDLKSKVSLINALRKVKTLFSKDDTKDQGVELFNIINDILEDKLPLSSLNKASSRTFSGGSDVHERKYLKDAIETQIKNFNDIDPESIKNNLDPESNVLFDKEYGEIQSILSNLAMTYDQIPLNELSDYRKKLVELISFGIKKKAMEVMKGKTNTWKLGKPNIKYKSELVNPRDMERLLDLVSQGKSLDQAKEELKKNKQEPVKPEEPKKEPIISEPEETSVTEPKSWADVLDEPDIDQEFTTKDQYADITETLNKKIRNAFLEDETPLDFGDVSDGAVIDEPEQGKKPISQAGFDYHGNRIQTIDNKNNKDVKDALDNSSKVLRDSVYQKTLNYLENEREILRNMRQFVESLKRRIYVTTEINSDKDLRKANMLDQFGGFLREIIYFAYRDCWKQNTSPNSMKFLKNKGVDPENIEYSRFIVDSILQSLIRTGPSKLGEYMQHFMNLTNKNLKKAAE